MRVGHRSWLLGLFLAACSGGFGPTDAEVDGSDDRPSSYEAGLCCQVTADFAGDNGEQTYQYPCDTDGGVIGDVPWICNVDSPAACDAPSCGVSSSCQGFGGVGTVVPCGGVVSPDGVRVRFFAPTQAMHRSRRHPRRVCLRKGGIRRRPCAPRVWHGN